MPYPDLDKLEQQLILEEGFKLLPYRDTKGLLTIGVGRNLDGNPLSPEEVAYIGHNGRTQAITREQGLWLLSRDIQKAYRGLDGKLAWWTQADEIRARVLADLTFNMGILKVLGFPHFLASMKAQDYDQAAQDLQNSLWYNQTKTRGVRLVAMVQTGEDYSA